MRSGLLLLMLLLSLSSLIRVLWVSVALTNLALWWLVLEHLALRISPTIMTKFMQLFQKHPVDWILTYHHNHQHQDWDYCHEDPHYWSHFDCLKTFPSNSSSENQKIFVFVCSTDKPWLTSNVSMLNLLNFIYLQITQEEPATLNIVCISNFLILQTEEFWD